MRGDRPVIRDLPLSKLDISALLASLSLVLAMAVGLSMSFSKLPARVPMHYGWNGLPDSWAGRSSLAVLLVIALPVNLLLLGVQRIPESYNFPVEVTPENARDLYTVTRRMVILLQLAINLVFASILLMTVLVARGVLSGIPPWWLLLVLGMILGVIVWGTLAARRVHHAHRRVLRP